ncbi:hypothetical protein DXM62_13280 [Salmonella enterica]|nr:hypothetical protein [Salmonella enterica]EEI9368107.1 hypothetical protein [Salmonella enterica subsp. enterica serovar Chester]EBG1488940.1 hypothetical protein [Salmonella enterica]EBM2626278.1 hypothetical protein [Salmonella enterica]EHF7715275.1 hypothetical protein [Salmonella enterica]
MKKFKRLSRFVATAPRPRLWGWLLAAVVMFLVIAVVSPQQLPVVVYKLSLISLAAVLGYWLDRSLFPKARPGQFQRHVPQLMDIGRYPVEVGCHMVFAATLIRRAIIVAAVCLAVAMGL